MDSTTILPPNYQGVISKTEDCNKINAIYQQEDHACDILQAISDSAQHIHNNIADGDRAIIREISDIGQHIQNNVSDGHRAIIKETADGTRLNLKEVADASRAILKDSCDNAHGINQNINEGTRFLQKDLADSSRILQKDVTDSTSFVRDSIERFGLKNLESSDRWGYRGVEATEHSSQKNLIAFKEQLLELEKAKQVLERQAADNKCSIERQAAENTCKIEMMQMKGQLEIQRQADQLAAQAAKERAECCCELKELIIEKASATDDLIRQQALCALKDELAQARQEVLIARLSGTTIPASV